MKNRFIPDWEGPEERIAYLVSALRYGADYPIPVLLRMGYHGSEIIRAERILQSERMERNQHAN